MRSSRVLLAVAMGFLAIPASLPAQKLKPSTVSEFDCYIQSAEARMAGRTAFLLADSEPVLMQQLTHGGKIVTVVGNGPNPHKITGAMVYDWVGSVFVPGATVERTIQMLQDYNHRSQYFPEVIASSKLLCRTGEGRFGFTMRMKEPDVVDVDSDVTWERIDARHWRCRSYSTDLRPAGKDHGYLLRLNSYWRFAETGGGVVVEGESITLSGEFGSMMRTLGSMMGINPEKSLKKTLGSIRETVSNKGLQFAPPPAGLPACGEPVRGAGCALQSRP
jgi:hypothetical protein